VLWRQDDTLMPPAPRQVAWGVPNAFPDRVSCARWIDDNAKRWEKNAAPNQTVTRSAGGLAAEFVTRTTNNRWSTLKFFCLPETVDPRGPKK